MQNERSEQSKNAPAASVRQGLLTRWLTRLGVSAEIMPGGFGLTLSGRAERGRDGRFRPVAEVLSVRGCRRILAYDPGEIRLAVGRLTLVVTGRDLSFASFTAGTVTVVGEVGGVTWQ